MSLTVSPRLRAPALLYWVLPLLICLAVFYRGLFAWFQQDDFVWLRLEIHSWRDFWSMLLEPRAQGTIRPWSERFFFIGFRRLFGLNALPYRLFVFLTQFANLALLTAVARRITGSGSAALLAAIIWTVNMALVSPMVWTSAYNQILCAFFFLSSLLLFLRHVETGRWSFYFWQVVVFLLGFGALETMVVYPAVLLVYCWLMARSQTWKALPLLVPSALYAVVHLWVIPRAASGPYALHLDWGIWRVLWAYWIRGLGPPQWAKVFNLPWLLGLLLALLLTAALMVLLVRAILAFPRVAAPQALFGLGWFLLTLAPVLPLREHQLDYYLTLPAIGLAMLVACLLPLASRQTAAAWLVIYAGCSAGFIERESQSLYQSNQTTHRLVRAVEQARALHPDKVILLDDVGESLFYRAIYHQAFLTAGIREVYLTPGSKIINTAPGMETSEIYQLPARATLAALRDHRAVVYRVAGGSLREITSLYALSARERLKPVAPRRVDVGLPLLAPQLGSGWYQIQGSHRWMSRRAEVRLAGPHSPGEQLRVQAIYPHQLDIGRFRLSVSADGIPLGTAEIRDRSSQEHFFRLPAPLAGREEMTVVLEVDRTFHGPNDPRELGVALGIIELVP